MAAKGVALAKISDHEYALPAEWFAWYLLARTPSLMGNDACFANEEIDVGVRVSVDPGHLPLTVGLGVVTASLTNP